MKYDNPFWPDLAKTPHNFVMWIRGMDAPLFDQRIMVPKKFNHALCSFTGELWTPKGLPVSAQLSDKSGFLVYSAGTLLLQVGHATPYLDVRLLLPTEEILIARVEIRPDV